MLLAFHFLTFDLIERPERAFGLRWALSRGYAFFDSHIL
jgi:hypothetical protein